MITLLVLCGSGEYTDSLSAVDLQVYEHIRTHTNNHPGSFLLFPTAAGQEPDYGKWNDMGTLHFKNLGIDSIAVDAPTREQLDSENTLSLLNESSAVYFSGGDPDYLYSQIKDSDFEKALIPLFNRGMPIVASSAGAMIMGRLFLKNPYTVFDQKAQPVWTPGLQLVDRIVIPHFNHISEAGSITKQLTKIAKTAPEEYHSELIGIDNDTALIIKNGLTYTTMGNGSVHSIIRKR